MYLFRLRFVEGGTVKKRFRKGATTIEALGCCLIILFFLMMIFHIYYQALAKMQVEEACVQISHDVVSCTSIDEADDLVQSEVMDMLGRHKNIETSTIECVVYYAIGGEQEWKKGNFLTVEVSAKASSPFFSISGKCRKIMTVMIERNEG